VLIVLVLIMMMGTTLVYLGTHNLNQIRTSGRQTTLRHAADGGLHELLDTLYQNPDYGQDQTASSSGVFSSSQGATRYSWTFDPSSATPWSTNNLEGETAVTGYGGRTVPPGCALLFVSAGFDGANANQSPTVVGAVTTNRFPYAVASDGVIDLSDVSSVIPGQGHLLSNNVGGNPNIQAGLVDGMSFSRDGVGSIRVSANSGPTNFNQPPVDLPDLPIQDMIASWSTAGIAGAHPYGGAADYQFSGDVTASTKKNGKLTVDGVEITAPATSLPRLLRGCFSIQGSTFLFRAVVRSAVRLRWICRTDGPTRVPTGPITAPATAPASMAGGPPRIPATAPVAAPARAPRITRPAGLAARPPIPAPAAPASIIPGFPVQAAPRAPPSIPPYTLSRVTARRLPDKVPTAPANPPTRAPEAARPRPTGPPTMADMALKESAPSAAPETAPEATATPNEPAFSPALTPT
jgi:hypothetical protein